MSAATNGPEEIQSTGWFRSNKVQAEEMLPQTIKGEGNKSWIYKTFKKRTCSQFIPSQEERRRCCCGSLDEDHQPEATRSVPKRKTKWKVSKHTKLVTTDAYGELEFTGAGQRSKAKFIRIAHDTDAEAVLELLETEWKLKLPKLLINVIGGAAKKLKNFTRNPELTHVLRKGLVNAAETTGAWIITGGLNTGVMRLVGEAAKGCTNLHLLGIATWGFVKHREKLVNSEGIVTYHMTSGVLSKEAYLDNNHSHFILVDDGTVGNNDGELNFRASLQNCLSLKKMSEDKSPGIPVVTMVLEGGPKTIRLVRDFVNSKPAVPVVIAEGSGKAADILAYAHSLSTSNNSELMERIQKAFRGHSEHEYHEMKENVLECVGKKSYVTIFRMDKDGRDLDKVLFGAILKAQNASAADMLSLSLFWNRADFAKTKLFTEKKELKMSTLEDAMMDALTSNRVEFVKLLLENGVSISSFLTRSRLEELYNGRAGSMLRVILRQKTGHEKTRGADLGNDTSLKERSSFTLDDVHNALRILGTAYKEEENKTEKTASCTANGGMVVDENNDVAYRKLFLWALICNMQQMALFMWERGEENLARALLAANMYSEMAKISEEKDPQSEMANELNKHAQEFKKLALDFLDHCHQDKEDLTQKLLARDLKNWGGETCLSLAVAIKHEEFLAHCSCQTMLTNIWTGNMKMEPRSSRKAILGILLPLTIFRLELKNSKKLLLMPKKQAENKKNSAKKKTNEEQNSRGKDEGNDLGGYSQQKNAGDPLVVQPRRTKKLWEFYSAPVTKFWSNVLAYLAFLVLFSYVILVRQEKVPSTSEIILIIFVSSLCTEEIRQILHSEPPWRWRYWNLLDVFSVLLFFVGLGLRLHLSTRWAGHVVYCIDVMFWIIRLLRILYVSESAGPCVVMIGHMTTDMLYFLRIMVIFLLAYGVAQQAILYPNEPAAWSMLLQIFFRPYFQAFGELFLDAPDTVDIGTTLFGTPRRNDHADTIVTVIMALYLLFVNILLLNLLIAIFNKRLSIVQPNANQIWKVKRYYLVMEYAQKPRLIPPFIIWTHIMYLFKGLRHCCRSSDRRLKLFLNKDELDELRLFEERCVYSYLEEKDTRRSASQKEKNEVIGNRLESVSARLSRLENHTHRIMEILEKLQKSLPDPGQQTCA